MSGSNTRNMKLDARSVIDGRRDLLPIEDIVYAFTAGAPGDSILGDKKGDIFATHAFDVNTVYVRTDGNLYWLAHFAHLKELETCGTEWLRSVNRSVLINPRRIAFRGRHKTVGFRLRDHRGHVREEVVRLSDEGKRVVDGYIMRPPKRSTPSPDTPKTPPRDSFPGGD